MKSKSCGPVEAFLPAVVWRASQCGWLRIGKTEHGHGVWDLELNGSPAFKPGLAKSSPTLSEGARQPLAFREIECGVCSLVANVLAGPNSSAPGNSCWSGPTA